MYSEKEFFNGNDEVSVAVRIQSARLKSVSAHISAV